MDSRFSAWKREQRRGNYSILMGTMVFAIMGFSALAVDISYITLSELQAQATADAASHAALVAYREQPDASSGENAGIAAANYIVARNLVGMNTADIDDIEFGEYNHASQAFCGPGCFGFVGNVNAVEVELSREGGNAVDLLLAPLFGVNTHEVDAAAITSQQQRAIMLVQDASGSMMGSGMNSAINKARIANLAFLNYLVAHPHSGDRLGLVQYASKAAIAPEAGGSGIDVKPADNVPPWAYMLEIEWNEPYLRERIEGICNSNGANCPSATYPTNADIDGMTNPGVAMEQAIGEIDRNSDETFFRGMVVFSDGEFNHSEGNNYYGAYPNTSNQRALDAANRAWDQHDIHIWTILLSNGYSVDPVAMDDLKRGLGFFTDTPNAAGLKDAYEEVAKSIPTVLVY